MQKQPLPNAFDDSIKTALCCFRLATLDQPSKSPRLEPLPMFCRNHMQITVLIFQLPLRWPYLISDFAHCETTTPNHLTVFPPCALMCCL